MKAKKEKRVDNQAEAKKEKHVDNQAHRYREFLLYGALLFWDS